MNDEQGPVVAPLPRDGAEPEFQVNLEQFLADVDARWARPLLVGVGVCADGAIVLLLAFAIVTARPGASLALLVVLFILGAVAVAQQIAIRRLRAAVRRQGALTLALQSRAEWSENLAVSDPLTDLFNRRFADEQLAKEIARAARQSSPLTLLLLDISGFQQLNEQYGSAVGDEALRTFGRHLKRAVRSSDIPVRIGHGEFMVILPECRHFSVPTALARLRRVTLPVAGAEIPLAFVAGWVEWQRGQSAQELLDRAQRALAADKQSGASQAEALRAAADAERGGKLQVVGQLTGQVAHDFNNILAIIRGYSEMALPGLQGNDAVRSNVSHIAKAAEHAAHLVSQLRAFVCRHSDATELIDLNQTVQEVMALLQPLLGEGIALSVTTGPPAPVRAQSGQIEQILLNLVTNAKDALSGHGAISIRTYAAMLGERQPGGNPETCPSRYVALVVSDNGKGMEESVRERVFQPYFTTKANGTGLGLTTVSGLVASMGGHVDVESSPGRGATFTVYLPRIEPADEPAAEGGETAGVLPAHSRQLRK